LDPFRVGLVFRSGQPLASAWSGVVAGLAEALSAAGCQVALVDAELPAPLRWRAIALSSRLRRHPHAGQFAPETVALRRGARAVRARPWPAVDAWVQLGTDFGPAPPGRVVTLEDMTLRAAARIAASPYARLPAGVAAAWEARQRRAYERASVCCTASRWTARSIVGDYGIDPEKVRVVGLGRNHDPPPAARDWGTPRFLFVGRNWERKGGPLLVRAFARLREELPAAELHLVSAPTGPLPEGVVAHGPQPLVEERRALRDRLFATSTCLVMPSLYEPLGIVHAEAAAAGMPSIGSALGGAADVIGEDGGLVVPPGDEEALLSALRRLADPATAQRMGSAARERSDLYRWDAVAARLLRALGRQPRSGPPVDFL
jgi:glycosyltransferase involved in cell wall biosynthesis